MRIGIVVTDAGYRDLVCGLVAAIRARDWLAECFLTDSGVALLADAQFAALARQVPQAVAVCEHSVAHFATGAFDIGSLAGDIVVGGQYQDAELVRRCDKVLVF